MSRAPKGYRFFDPATGRLVISRDVIFDEGQPWKWTNAADETVQLSPESFVVHYESDENLTIDGADVQPAAEAEGEASIGQGVVAPHEATPSPQNSPDSVQSPHHNLATPPSQGFDSSEERTPRYRTLTDLFDHTKEMLDYEYSGMCLLAADEPLGVDEALEEQCWVDAMETKLESIRENNTWCYADLPKGH
jgi:hypothetical protein